ncbi:hypothetical protein R2R35_07610 [Anaerocolumna sp. AGMB13020]|uniref:hypothetical protein n=1 Tax=Anaerocolumna sp. AGMB13020 TaxID=3081750 RepID=UPI002953AA07|nr:hypothetical protein [Anaerocolumna sp. AGMB13020]WOO38360.1 hypothetical protein R2R35_07610 [Anaerocolumna sp. AGMB13020]
MSFNNNNGFNNGFFGGNNNQSLVNHMCKYIGQTVIIFTTSGGVSGCGFTGVLLSVNCEFVRLDSRRGAAPDCPLGSSCCGNFDNNDNDCGHGHHHRRESVGSVCDIPIESIVAFCHNAI